MRRPAASHPWIHRRRRKPPSHRRRRASPSTAAAGLAPPPSAAARSGQRARWPSSSSRSSRERLASCRRADATRLWCGSTASQRRQLPLSLADPPHKARPLHQLWRQGSIPPLMAAPASAGRQPLAGGMAIGDWGQIRWC
ncbi:hypothetical protein SORBI_3009G070900 [Sorghum bicolor]|uniref:Uncharacterized protein n=1 Tax=Sorghum bicolor TaxID=4558 RepID=A0A1B6P748_SORBI|nr:hypothetical protein SORBI_3009G070900 [Sorghum bicolor]